MNLVKLFSHTISFENLFTLHFTGIYHLIVISSSFKAYRSRKKFRSMSFALGINWERRVFAPVIANSLKVSSLITAKLLLRRRLHVSGFSKLTLLCCWIMSRFSPWAVTIQKTNHGKMIIESRVVYENYLSG